MTIRGMQGHTIGSGMVAGNRVATNAMLNVGVDKVHSYTTVVFCSMAFNLAQTAMLQVLILSGWIGT